VPQRKSEFFCKLNMGYSWHIVRLASGLSNCNTDGFDGVDGIGEV
jgi:hypothetical protein